MQLEIWSDVVCPWCAIGRANLRTALADHPRADQVEVVWRSFQLDPTAPAEHDQPYVERLAAKYRTSQGEARAMMSRVEQAGAAVGVEFDFEAARSGNTLDAHRLIHLARDRGVQDEVKARLLQGVLSQGLPLADHDALADAVAEAGLDRDEAAAVLASDRYADAVRDDLDTAYDLGVSGVPFFVLDRRFAVSGAQPPAVLAEALDRALDAGLEAVGGAGGRDQPHDADAAQRATSHDHAHAPDEACADGSCEVA